MQSAKGRIGTHNVGECRTWVNCNIVGVAKTAVMSGLRKGCGRCDAPEIRQIKDLHAVATDSVCDNKGVVVIYLYIPLNIASDV